MKKDMLVEFINPKVGINPEIIAKHGTGPYLLLEEPGDCDCRWNPHYDDCESLIATIRAGGVKYRVKMRELRSATISAMLTAVLAGR